MPVHRLHCQQDVAAPLAEVFAFFSKPENLQELTPVMLHFAFMTPTPIRMREGALIDYALRVKGLPIHWRTLITCYEPPHRFIDQQIKGPYQFWHHTHTFTPLPAGGTRIEDEVLYALPFGPFGELAHRCFVRRDLERIFQFRFGKIQSRFGVASA